MARPVNCEALYGDVAVFTMTPQLTVRPPVNTTFSEMALVLKRLPNAHPYCRQSPGAPANFAAFLLSAKLPLI